jgi:hypothetical protein
VSVCVSVAFTVSTPPKESWAAVILTLRVRSSVAVKLFKNATPAGISRVAPALATEIVADDVLPFIVYLTSI